LEALGLLAFMIGAGAFGTLFLYPGSPVSQALPSDFARRTALGACMGVVTFGVVTAIGPRTGAHINPAVTWSFYRLGKISGWNSFFYTLAQFAGAMIAPVLLLAAIGAPFADAKVKYATSRPGPAGDLVAFAAEFVISFILIIAVLISLDSKRLEKLTPAIIGVLIAVFIAFESPLSGMSLNPARSFGSALTAGQWDGLWVYFTAPVLAMLLATEAYRLMRARRQRLVTADYEADPHYPFEPKEHAYG